MFGKESFQLYTVLINADLMNDVDFFSFFYRAAERRGILETLPRNSGNFAAEFRGPCLYATYSGYVIYFLF